MRGSRLFRVVEVRPSRRSAPWAATAFVALAGALAALGWSAGASAQWPAFPDPTAPRDADGNVIMDAPTP
ncbi:MAG TPA: hypothetical protein VIN61_04955, partial [Gammaproteobacteria bacterium]